MTWVFAGLGLIAALGYQAMLGRPVGALRSAVKTGATLMLALASLAAGAPMLLVLALALGALGDFFLSREGQGAFLKGVASFALAHAVYVALFAGLPGGAGLMALSWPRLGGVVGLLALAASTPVWLLPHAGPLKAPVAGYVGIITAMGIAALHLAGDFSPAAIGAALFLGSDLILSVQLFRLRAGSLAYRAARQAVWPLYWGGQALIAFGVARGLGAPF